MLEELQDKRLSFVTGKGGVGKSTVVAALGRALAQLDRDTLIVETDAYSAMEGLLDVELADNTITPVDPPLHAVQLSESECIVEAISRFIPSKRIVRSLLDNQVARVFFKAAPGVNQFAILDQVRQYLQDTDDGEPRWDNIIVDLPASGHAVTFLSVPKTLSGIIEVGPIGEATEEVAELIRDPARSAITAVCLPEEMPVNETVEFEQQLRPAVDRGLTVAFANMVHRAPIDPEHEETFSRVVERVDRSELMSATIGDGPLGDRAVERVVAGNVLAMDWHQRDRRYLEELHERLQATVHEIPVFYEADGTDIVTRVARHLLGERQPEETSDDTSSDSLAS